MAEPITRPLLRPIKRRHIEPPNHIIVIASLGASGGLCWFLPGVSRHAENCLQIAERWLEEIKPTSERMSREGAETEAGADW